ncbi:MAG: HAMP domain-containing sensor histidine kinase, partial [Endomicrobiaceae bacterium]|nr:HAMP domain-containing sensor histidine kinase [Endomicrobiaceae bacterium]
ESLETNVKKTNDVVSSILNYAKIESKQLMFEHFKFGEIIDLSFELLSAKHKITDMGNLKIIRNFKDDSTVFAVQAHMMEIVYNLIDNAYEAICEKHNILTGENLKNFVPEIAIALSKKDKITTIHISDNGIGVKEENLSKIFVPFFTTKSSTKSGTGIGMYIAKRIIAENLKGRIWIESTYMHGTDIFIELPNI